MREGIEIRYNKSVYAFYYISFSVKCQAEYAYTQKTIFHTAAEVYKRPDLSGRLFC